MYLTNRWRSTSRIDHHPDIEFFAVLSELNGLGLNWKRLAPDRKNWGVFKFIFNILWIDDRPKSTDIQNVLTRGY